MRLAIGLTFIGLASGCAIAHPIASQNTNNSEITVERLFDYDGCTVYRFRDGVFRYYTKCTAGTSSVSWQESCGKSCVQDVDVPTAYVAP